MHASGLRKLNKQTNEQTIRPFHFMITKLQANKSADLCSRGKKIEICSRVKKFCNEDDACFALALGTLCVGGGSDSMVLFLKIYYTYSTF